MKASDYVIQFLAEQGVHHVFQVIGGAITHLIDSTIDYPDVACITMHHEQAAAFAAEGYARLNNTLGVAMATSGPGATNLITGIGSCFFDSVPTLFITGQVNTYEYKFDKPIRQWGFQETDIVSVVKPITKGAKLVSDAATLIDDLNWAVALAQSDRPGPVVIDIPMNIQRTNLTITNHNSQPQITPREKPVCENIPEILQRLANAKRPVILAGGGVRTANACEELFTFIEKTQTPVVASLMGVDAFPHDHPAYSGMIGAYGNRYANLTIANADFLLILGSRLDSRQTGTRPESFARSAFIVHVDIDEHELNRVVETDYAICENIKTFLQNILEQLHTISLASLHEWQDKIKLYKSCFPSYPVMKDAALDPNEFLYLLSQEVDDDAVIVLDVGQHQMWTAQSFVIKKNQRMLISGGMGSMGFALPTAIGAYFAAPTRQLIVITGDGGLQMNIQEFQTIIRNNIPIKIILMNNNSLGMVRQFQQTYFNGREQGTVDGYSCPDFIKIATAYGFNSHSISQLTDANTSISALLETNTPYLLEVKLPQKTVVEPKLVVNHAIENQDPKIPHEQLKELMLIPLYEHQS